MRVPEGKKIKLKLVIRRSRNYLYSEGNKIGVNCYVSEGENGVGLTEVCDDQRMMFAKF